MDAAYIEEFGPAENIRFGEAALSSAPGTSTRGRARSRHRRRSAY
ncbi:hypothetical protein ABT104_03440 [Streptomyces mobaraensis]